MKKRMRLVNLVLEESYSIARAGRKLSIKPSTAKLIVKRFRETGTFATRNTIRNAP